MVKTISSNSSIFSKKIKKLTLNLSCAALLTCPALASYNLNNLAECVEGVITQRITQPLADLSHDISKSIERELRPEPSNLMNRVIQKISDKLEDAKDKVERKFRRSIENWLINNLK